MNKAKLVLADGTTFEGRSFGATGDAIGEVVFNTSMFGYQEILTDPSYVGQIVTMTTAHIGNVGTNPEDQESQKPHPVGMVVRNYQEPSNWRARETLHDYLSRFGVVGIYGLDTRRLVRHLRSAGSQYGCISSSSASPAELAAKARAAPPMLGLDLATQSSTRVTYPWTEGTPAVLDGGSTPALAKNPKHVVAVDYGLKRSMLRYLVDSGCRVTVVPSDTTKEAILALRPEGVFLTNGPGDPAAVPGAAKTVEGLLGKVPIFGICLGHQILALALGGRTYKMKFGHRGGNQPVMELATKRVEITSHNHGFAVDAESLRGGVEVTHINLNDGTVEGIAAPALHAWSVQYHPESSPGPRDALRYFSRFTGSLV